MVWVDDVLRPMYDDNTCHIVPTVNAHTIPYAYTSGLPTNALMSAIPPATVLVETRPRSNALTNSNIAAI